MSLLKFVNMFLLQWFFIRLAKEIDTDTKEIVRWVILKWIIPCTGWKRDYKFIGKEN